MGEIWRSLTRLRRYLEMEILPAVTPVSSEGVYIWRNLPYGRPERGTQGKVHPKHHLDVFVPSAPFPRPLLPVLLFLHGGSWTRGDRQLSAALYSNLGVACATRNVLCVVCSYRLAPAHAHPAQVQDAAAALEWVRTHAPKFGGDPQRVFLMGHSAGAHLALLSLTHAQWMLQAAASAEPTTKINQASATAATAAVTSDTRATADVTAPTPPAAPKSSTKPSTNGRGEPSERSPAFSLDAGGRARTQTRPAASPYPYQPAQDWSYLLRGLRGVIGISGVYDLLKLCESSTGATLARPAFTSDSTALKSASPLHLLASSSSIPPLLSVPVLLVNAEDDFDLDSHAEAVELELKKAQIKHGVEANVDRYVITGRNHASIITSFGQEGDPTINLVLNFVHKHANPSTTGTMQHK